MNLDKIVTKLINKGVELGGTLVPEDIYNKRVEICSGCDKQGIVEPLPMVKMVGCTICTCPTATKPRFETYYSFSKLKTIQATCPHESGDKWKDIF